MNHWGRIFFFYDSAGRLTHVKGQPLANHTENCRLILEQFHRAGFHPETRDRLIRAVTAHDEGKRETFRIVDDREEPANKGADNAPRKLGYSFSGHRFRVPADDPYVVGLIRSHHEFSVEQINRERARLTEAEKLRFPDDLYLLCMSDHLEAELAVKSVEKADAAPRTFMEFVTERIDGSATDYTVIPWPFETDRVSITFQLLSLTAAELGDQTRQTIQKTLETGKSFTNETVSITLRSA